MSALNPWHLKTRSVVADSPDVVEVAERRLRCNPYQALRKISCDYSEGNLTLSGCLPSYFLKQMAQAAIGQINGVKQIINEIEVASPR